MASLPDGRDDWIPFNSPPTRLSLQPWVSGGGEDRGRTETPTAGD